MAAAGPNFRSDFDGRDLSAEATIHELDAWVMARLGDAYDGEGVVKTTFFCLAMHNPKGPPFPQTPWGVLIVDHDGGPLDPLRLLYVKLTREYRALAVYFAAVEGDAVYLTREHRTVGNRAWRAPLGETLSFQVAPPRFTGFLDAPSVPN